MKKCKRLKSTHRVIVIAHPVGQLGNRLFLSAHFIAFAHTFGFKICNPALGEYAEFFEGSQGDVLCQFPKKRYSYPKCNPALRCWLPRMIAKFTAALARIPKIEVLRCKVLDILSTNDCTDEPFPLRGEMFRKALAGSGYLLVRGWKFRDEESLITHQQIVAQYFRPIASVRERIQSCVEQARKGANLLIGVHVRQGDYREWLGGKYFYELEDYHRWMQQAKTLWPDRKIAFLICSNTPCATDAFPNCQTSNGPGDPIGDLYALAACDYLIGPPSTFSLWASYYGRVPLHMLESKEQTLHPVSFKLHDRV